MGRVTGIDKHDLPGGNREKIRNGFRLFWSNTGLFFVKAVRPVLKSLLRIINIRPITIRHRLFALSVLMIILPAIAFGTAAGLVGLKNGRQQVVNQLESVAVLKEAEVNAWVNNAKADLLIVMSGTGAVQQMRTILSTSPDIEEYQSAYQSLLQYFGAFVNQTQRFDEIFLMDLNRRVVLSTDIQREGGVGGLGSNAYFQEGLRGEYLHPPSFTNSFGGVTMVVVRPVYDEDGEVRGIIAGRAGPEMLNRIMLERTGLGETGETYLVTSKQVMLTQSRYQVVRWSGTYIVYTVGAKSALKDHINGSGIYLNYRDEMVVGVFRWLPELQVALLAEQTEREAMKSVYQTVALDLGVAVAAVIIAGSLSLSLARNISTPLKELAQTAGRVSNGEFDLTVPVDREDEVGDLARAFNSMTVRIQDLINNLEFRVAERTRTLKQRALQLETGTQVSREITSILDTEELMKRVVRLIAETFDYYHVAIFLIDEKTQKLVFRSGAGRVLDYQDTMIASLAIGPNSLNGEAALSNQAIVVNNVAQDSRFLPSPSLPETRSELVVPLRIGYRVIGTLDVHCCLVNAFTDYDARIIQGLGDQVAIAIENARLYSRSRALAVIEERNRLAHELHDSVTQSLYSIIMFTGAMRELIQAEDYELLEKRLERTEFIAQQALRELRLLLFEMRPSMLEQEGLAKVLKQRLASVEEKVGIKTRLSIDQELDLEFKIEELFLRVALESLNNSLKHAAASCVSVTIQRKQDWVEMQVTDDGIGFDVDSALAAGGLGLAGIHERARKNGGLLTIESSPGCGVRINLKVKRSNGTVD